MKGGAGKSAETSHWFIPVEKVCSSKLFSRIALGKHTTF